MEAKCCLLKLRLHIPKWCRTWGTRPVRYTSRSDSKSQLTMVASPEDASPPSRAAAGVTFSRPSESLRFHPSDCDSQFRQIRRQ